MKNKDNNLNPTFSPMEYIQFRLSSVTSKTFPEIVEEAGYDLSKLTKKKYSDMFGSLSLLKEVLEELCNKKELSEKFDFNIELIEINETELDLVLAPGQTYNTLLDSTIINKEDTVENYESSDFYKSLLGKTTCFVFYKKYKGTFKIFTTSILNMDNILDETLKDVYEKVLFAKNTKNKAMLNDNFTNGLPNNKDSIFYFEEVNGVHQLIAGKDFLEAIFDMLINSKEGRSLEIYFRAETEDIHRANRKKIVENFKKDSLLNIEQKVNRDNL